MEIRETVYLQDTAVGHAVIAREGLYCRFSCRCRLPGDTVYRLVARWGEHTLSLGIPVPQGKEFVLDTRIPAKQLGNGKPRIMAVPRHPQLAGKFIPLAPEEPFRYLSRLKNAWLAEENGRLGIVLPE